VLVNKPTDSIKKMTNTAIATLGAGCFWCVEAVYQRLEGVLLVESGYEGGQTKNPTYKEICTGTTGHAEVCRITYDTDKLSFEELLEVFWKTHDPTTLNRQGGDVGTQYRSVVFYHSEEQKNIAEACMQKIEEAAIYADKIVTEISPSTVFYVAENYHQDYFNQNGYQPYCQFVVRPKVEKFNKIFGDKMKRG
jgi:peptide-methionine (S)-S-oxide reductase